MLEGLHSFGFYTRNLRMAEMWKKMGPQRVGDCRGLPVNCWGLPGTDRNRRGQPATAGDCGGRPGLPGTARDGQDCQRLPGTARTARDCQGLPDYS